MSFLNLDKNRRIIPVWRNFHSTSNSGELIIHKKESQIIRPIDNIDFLKSVNNWKFDKNIINAIELMNISLVYGDKEYLVETAEFIINNKRNVPSDIITLANSIISPEYLYKEKLSIKQNHSKLRLFIRGEITRIKSLLHQWPRHSILWAELSRLYTILGLKDKAKKAMTVAESLSSENRYIARSAARFHIHYDDPEKAKYIIQKTRGFNNDPWLLSADIAISSILKKKTKSIDKGISILKREQFSHGEVTELASAIGTIQTYDGSYKNAKKSFILSLLSPNDNSLAQAEWAKSHIKSLILPDSSDIPNAFEAKARHSMRQGNWKSTMENCMKWILDEPYSSRPAILGSFVTSAMSRDYECGEEFCRFGLLSNPQDNILKNNLSVILAYQGKLEEAKTVFNTITNKDINTNDGLIRLATEGLLDYRSGNILEGRLKYEKAISIATKLKKTELAEVAYLHFAREEIRARTTASHKIYEEANKKLSKYKSKEIEQLKNNLTNLYGNYNEK